MKQEYLWVLHSRTCQRVPVNAIAAEREKHPPAISDPEGCIADVKKASDFVNPLHDARRKEPDTGGLR